MEEILTSIENHQGASICVAIFIIIVIYLLILVIIVSGSKRVESGRERRR